MTSSARDATRLTRLPPEDGESAYFHPNGYVIVRTRRSWNERVGRIAGQADRPGPKVWWAIYPHAGRSRVNRFRLQARRFTEVETTATLAEARQWCDENPREGWA